MARKKSKIRTLRQYLTDFKREPHRCTCCQAKLNGRTTPLSRNRQPLGYGMKCKANILNCLSLRHE